MAYFPPNDLTTSGNITTQNLVPAGVATAASAVTLSNLNAIGSVSVQLSGTWTAAGGLSFQGTIDGTTWITFSGNNISLRNALTTTGFPPSGTNGNIYTIDITGYAQFRVTALGAVTGTLTVSLRASQTQNMFSITGAGTNGQVPVSILSTPNIDQLITGQATQTASGQNIILPVAGTGSQAVAGYKTIAIQIIPTGTVSSGVVTFEASNDGTTWVALPLYDEASLTTNPISTVSPATGVNRFFLGPLYWAFIRARISTVIGGGGSIAAITMLSQAAYQPDVYTVTQQTAGNLNATAVIASGTVTTVSTVTTLANGQTAHSSASTGSPLRIGGRTAPITIATVDTSLVAGDASEVGVTTGMQIITKDFGPSELDITIPVLPSVTVTTVQSILGASGTASVRNYITGLTLQTDTLGIAGSAFIVDGQGAIGTSVTIATPGVFTSTTHDLRVGDSIIFTSLGTITGISVNTMYYVTITSFAATTFTIALTPGGTAIQITGSTSAFTFYRIFHVLRLGTAAIATPVQTLFNTPLKGMSNQAMNILIPVSLVTGAIYLTVSGYRGF